tara:strand:+ start:34226 stop:34753 length:528 start_codon:yes stop_codon:yes gene_type:complete
MDNDKPMSKRITGLTNCHNSEPGSSRPAHTVTLKGIEGKIAKAEYAVFGPTLTVCVLTLENGFKITGESACASPENFDKDEGEDIAYKKAREKVWMLEGYLLKETLYEENLMAYAKGAAGKIGSMQTHPATSSAVSYGGALAAGALAAMKNELLASASHTKKPKTIWPTGLGEKE